MRGRGHHVDDILEGCLNEDKEVLRDTTMMKIKGLHATQPTTRSKSSKRTTSSACWNVLRRYLTLG